MGSGVVIMSNVRKRVDWSRFRATISHNLIILIANETFFHDSYNSMKTDELLI